jgi:peptide/nickel transport system permease protein
MFGGAVIAESIFAVPGVGGLLIESINFRDFPVVQSLVLVLALVVLLINLLTDVLYGVLDPRIRYR